MRLTALGFYLIAYFLWFLRTLVDQRQDRHDDKWYGFAPYKIQFSLSAILGAVGCVISVIGFFFPPLLVPAAWLFLVGNTIWVIGEYHKFKNPPENDENYAPSYQDSYLRYSVIVTTITLISAISATCIFCFPAISIPIFIFSALLCIGLSIISSDLWLEANFGEHRPLHEIQDSYTKLNHSLGPSKNPLSQCLSNENSSTHSYMPILNTAEKLNDSTIDVPQYSAPKLGNI